GPYYHDFLAVVLGWSTVCVSIFVLSWWLPQWVVWLVPMGSIMSGTDIKLARWWTGVNFVFVVNNLTEFPRNLDGSMLTTLFGHGVNWTYAKLLGGHGVSLVYSLLLIGMIGVVYHGVRSLKARKGDGLTAAWLWYIVPLVGYLLAMVAQLVIA
ncbi:MAG: hypothetical protein C7B44_15220, partial [Sulfobacillus thermosulfidooxidans]